MVDVVLRDVRFCYPGANNDTLPGVNLEITSGSAHGLLGGSGTGKTTLLNLLSGLLQPQSGSIQFSGREMAGVPGRDRNVAQVFQFPVLYPRLTVQENLGLPLKLKGWRHTDVQHRVGAVAEELELAPYLTERPTQLSLYQKQLVAIGRAIIRPDVGMVLLDEPLTAVEANVRWVLRDTLRKIRAEHGVTMLYVTHDQTEALAFAERVSVMHEGVIVQTAAAEALHDAPEHEYVGYFIGNPSMNFLPATVDAGQIFIGQAESRFALSATQLPPGSDYKLGFRSSWAQWRHSGLPVTVNLTRPTGTRDGKVQSRAECEVASLSCVVDAQGDEHTNHHALQLGRWLLFRQGQRVATFNDGVIS